LTGPAGRKFSARSPTKLDAQAPAKHSCATRAVGLNFIDCHHRSGRYPLPAYPSPIGLEAAGVVLEVGPGVTDLAPGDRVAYSVMRVGAYSDVRVVAADRLLRVPDRIDLVTAAGGLNKGLTAHFL
jgi:NADPH:quinone reductase